MFDNINWNKIINDILSHVEEDWKYLMIKATVSKTSYSAKIYYAKKDMDFIDLWQVIAQEKMMIVLKNALLEFKKMTENFSSLEETMLLTIKVENTGDVKILYRDIKEGDKLSFDTSHQYLELNENDKQMW